MNFLVGGQKLVKISRLVKPALVVIHPGLHQQPRYPVLHLHHLLDHQAPVAKYTAPVSNLGRSHMALGKKVAAQAVGDLACINLVVLLLGRSDRPQHQRMRDLHLFRMRKQMTRRSIP